ncbi:MAG: hypothetical protein WBH15_03485, partial [Candidatus Methanoculleus thermohydrogenotrophicum]
SGAPALNPGPELPEGETRRESQRIERVTSQLPADGRSDGMRKEISSTSLERRRSTRCTMDKHHDLFERVVE